MPRTPSLRWLLVVAVFVLSSAAAFAQTVSFVESKDFAVGVRPVSVAVGEFNGDGMPDLVVARQGISMLGDPGGVSVLLGNGDGTFQAARSLAAGSQPRSVAVGDFNLDETADLAVANSSGVSVLLGNGDGTFQVGQPYAAGANPRFITVGDFNLDTLPDLVVANFSSNNVSVLLGNADGTFQAARTFAADRGPSSVAVSDFNGDGVSDLAIANTSVPGPGGSPGSMSVLLGNGDGTFQAARNFAAGRNPVSVVVGDFDGDGRVDLVVANYAGLGISVLLGNGDGTFQTPRDFASGISIGSSSERSIAVGDFNGDGKRDVASGNSGVMSVLLGNGDGTLQAPLAYASGGMSVAIGDFNGDGVSDLAVTYVGFDLVSVMLGNGDGTFQAVRVFSGGSGVMAVGDVNGDGVLDRATPSQVNLGYGDGTFAAPLPVTDVRLDNGASGLTLADFNGDGVLDLAVSRPGSFRGDFGEPITDPGDVSVLLGNGDGTFQLFSVFGAGNVPHLKAAGDFNRDGISDLVVTNPWYDTVFLALGNGDGTFHAPLSFATGSDPQAIAVSDFNTDGYLDLAVANEGATICSPDCSTFPSSVSVLLGNGDGTFQPASTLAGADKNYRVAAGDFNGDGLSDLAVVNDPLWAKPYSDTDSIVAVLLGNGDGTFRSAVPYAVDRASHVTVGDLNGDGVLDLAVSRLNNGTAVLVGTGDGSFQAAGTFGLYSTTSAAVGDLNGDGKLDLVTNNFEVLINDTAVVPIPQSYSLTVNRQGNGGGTVTSSSNPAGATEIDCGTTCDATYANGTVVTLTAQAEVGSTFAGWSGCDEESGTTCTVTMNAGKSVVATFDLQRFGLTVTKNGIGRGAVTSISDPESSPQINCGTICSADYDWNTVVTLRATPALGSLFLGWRGCDAVSRTTCTVTISAARSVTATFQGLSLAFRPQF